MEFPSSFGVKNEFSNSYVKDREHWARSVTIEMRALHWEKK